jgi:signal transduction histidine kinase
LKILRAFIFIDTLLLTLGLVMALRYAPFPPAASLRAGIVGNPSVLSLGAAGLGILAVVLWLTSDLPLVDRRRLTLGLSVANILIAVLVLILPLDAWLGAMEFPLGLAFFGLGVGLAWVGLRPPSPGAVAAEIAALKIPDETRQALLQQVGEAAAQEERNRLARDLHDSIKQQLFSINVGTAAAQERWDQDPEGALKALGEVRRCAREAMVEMQAMLHQLRPEALGTAGLIEALREQCEAQGYRTGAEVTLALGEPIPDDRMPPGAQDTLFRIGQEMLANAARHARARHVRLWLGRQGEALTLAVEDDGQGFDSTAPASGMGLRNLKERAISLGGSLEITSRLGAGTRAQVWAPLAPAGGSARGLKERSLSLNRNTFMTLSLALLLAHNNPRHPFPDPLFIVRFVAVELMVLSNVVTSWWEVRDGLRKFPDAAIAALASFRYTAHRGRALVSLAGAWLSFQSAHVPGGWGVAFCLLGLLLLVVMSVDLFGAHRWSRPYRRPLENWAPPSKWEWPQGSHPTVALGSIVALGSRMLMAVMVILVIILEHEFWAKPEQLLFIALEAALLAYFFWRRPRLEGASS